MSYPEKKVRENALLCLIYFSNKHVLNASQTYKPLADYFKLTDRERTELLRKRNEPHWNNLIQNSRKDLKREGYLGGQVHDVWDLTEYGINKAEKISNEHLALLEIAINCSISIEPSIIEKLRIPIPVEKRREAISINKAIDIDEPSLPLHSSLEINRIIRDTSISKELKSIYENKCQICGAAIQLPNGCFSEVHHLQPLGGSHKGYDIKENMIVVCPNHHAQFDYKAIAIDPDTFEIILYTGQILGKLFLNAEHKLGIAYLKYHYRQVFNSQ